MGTYNTNSEFSSCEVGGFIATALIYDLRVNNFTFTNFPEVDVQSDEEKFHITLKAHGASSSTFSLNYATVKSDVSLFREKKKVSQITFDIIQKHVAELERAVSILNEER